MTGQEEYRPVQEISIVVLNHNGRDLLERCLRSLKEALGSTPIETIVVENASTDGSRQMLTREFPWVTVVARETNGFVTAYNDGVQAAQGEWVLLLNNDMEFEPGFLEPLLAFMRAHGEAFAVGAMLVAPDGRMEKCRNLYQWSHGWLSTPSVSSAEPTPSFFVGTHGLFNRKKYIALGGFDKTFQPFYSEDVDLCYRAWKRGWETYIVPASRITHVHMATIGRLFDKRYVLRAAARNKFLLQWRNIDDRSMRLVHLFWLPANILGCLVSGKSYYLGALCGSWSYRWDIADFRRRESTARVLEDREIMRRSSR